MPSRLDSPFGTWTIGLGWSENSGVFSHTSGTDVLSNNTPILFDQRYFVTYTIQNRTAGSITINVGGRSQANITSTGTWITSSTFTTSSFMVTPTTNFNGTITFSLGTYNEDYHNSYAKGGASVVGWRNRAYDKINTPDEVSKKLSGIIIEQNKKNQMVTTSNKIEQEFYFPNDYIRGDKTPSLTGFQIYLTNNNNADTTIEYELQRYDQNFEERVASYINITAVSASNGEVTYTTNLNHGFKLNDQITIVGFSPSGYNGNYKIINIPANNQFKVKNVTTGSATIKGLVLASSILSTPIQSGGQTYYGANVFAIKSAKIKNKTGGSKKIYGEYTYRLTKKTKEIKKGSLVKLNGVQKLSVPSVIQAVHQAKKYTEITVYGSKYALPKNKKMVNINYDVKKTNVVLLTTSNPSDKARLNAPDIGQTIDERFDDHKGWQGIGRGEFKITNNDSGWKKILFSSIDIDEDWLDQKFKLILKSNQSLTYHYISPGVANQKFYNNWQSIDGSLVIKFFASTGDEGEDFLSNKFRSIALKNDVQNVLNSNVNFWSSKPNPSKYGVEALYFDVSDTNNDAVVIDSIYLNPISPNVQFNIYYSNDETEPEADVNSWDYLLWDYVPKVFKANKQQSYALPFPITAKYIKIEFTNLQAEYYNPGHHDKPILYKKFPTWVLNYFMSIYELEYDKTEDLIITGQTNLRYDLFRLAFNYYRGDIINSTTANPPVVIEENNGQSNTVVNLLKNASVDLEELDIISLTNIKAAFDQFRTHPGHRVENSVVGKSASLESISNFFNYSVERLNPAVADTTIVSQTNRNNLLIEKQMPQMYFYPTCRHRYREAYAKFENNKAYFVKIKEIRFERKANNIINDEILYKFVPGDKNNFDRCDFNISTSKWSLT